MTKQRPRFLGRRRGPGPGVRAVTAREREELFRGLSAACPVGIFRADLDGCVTYANLRVQQLWALPEEALLGLGWLERVHPDDRPALLRGWTAANQEGRDFETTYRVVVDGIVRWVHGRSAVLRDTAGQPLATVGTVDDISERVRAEEHRLAVEHARQLEVRMQERDEVDRLKDEFLAVVSHEMRTPLSNMRLALGLVDVTELPEKYRRHFEILKVECERQFTLINDLLDLQRAEAGKSPPVPERIPLAEWLAQQLQPFASCAEERGVHLEWQTSPDNFAAFADRRQLERIVSELFNNACKYTPDHGSIYVEADFFSPQKLLLSVINDCLDLSPEELTRLFEKFYRSRNCAASRQRGSGLGLALVQQLVRGMDSDIRVEQNQGQIMFSFELPALEDG